MGSVPVHCPFCHSTEIIKAGKQANSTQRYRCQNGQCERRIFLLHYQNRGRLPEIRRQVVDMAITGEWHAQHRPRVAHQSHDRHRHIKKQPPRCNTPIPC